VRDLRHIRVHALALARGEDDDLKGCAHQTKRAGFPLPVCVAPLVKEFCNLPSSGKILTP
jgi:hypothetical protein